MCHRLERRSQVTFDEAGSPAGPCPHPFHPLVPSLTQSGLMFRHHYRRPSRCNSTPTPFRQFKGHESWGVLIRCLQIHIQHEISPPHLTSLFAALEKSDREASQLAPSVPLLSYRTAAGCAGLKGSHWWAELEPCCQTGGARCKDDF